jgi:hypothetical protein
MTTIFPEARTCEVGVCCAPSNDNVVDCGIAGCSSVGAITLEQITEDAMGYMISTDYCGTMLHVCDLNVSIQLFTIIHQHFLLPLVSDVRRARTVTCCAPSNDNVVDCGIAGCSSVGYCGTMLHVCDLNVSIQLFTIIHQHFLLPTLCS